MQKLLQLTYYVAFWSLFGCAANKPPASSTPFEDQISSYRIKFEDFELVEIKEEEPEKNQEVLVDLQPEMSVTKKVDDKLLLMGQYYLDRPYEGFRILLYSGQRRNTAEEILKDFGLKFEDEEPELAYEQPNWKVKVGEFSTRLEAYSSLVSFKSEFPGAIIVPETIKNRGARAEKGDQNNDE